MKAKHCKCPGRPLKLQLYQTCGLLLSSPCGSGRTDSPLQLCFPKWALICLMGSWFCRDPRHQWWSSVLFLLAVLLHFWFPGFNKVDCRALVRRGSVWSQALWTLLNLSPFTSLLLMSSLKTYVSQIKVGANWKISSSIHCSSMVYLNIKKNSEEFQEESAMTNFTRQCKKKPKWRRGLDQTQYWKTKVSEQWVCLQPLTPLLTANGKLMQ